MRNKRAPASCYTGAYRAAGGGAPCEKGHPMPHEPQFLPAASLALDALADLFTRSFEGYFYPATISPEALALRVRGEQIDLARSIVLQVDGAPAGFAVLALRGEHAWCGGFGIVRAQRGRGLALPLAKAMLAAARAAGARRMSLEVLTRNAPALATYRRAGFEILRDLQILRWEGANGAPPAETAHPGALVEAEPRALLAHFDALHPVPAAWQRDLPALLVRAGLRGLALIEDARPAAYVLFQGDDGGALRIADLGATRAEGARIVLHALQARGTSLTSSNEPANSALTAAFADLGFAEIDRQHELWIDLT